MEPCSETKAPVTKTKAPVTMNRVSIFLFSLPLPCSAFHLSILSEVWLLNFLRIDGMSSETHWRTPSFFKAPPTRWWYMCRGLKFTHGISIICILVYGHSSHNCESWKNGLWFYQVFPMDSHVMLLSGFTAAMAQPRKAVTSRRKTT